MTIEITDNPELQSQLVAQMGQGITAGNIEAPKQADIASFRALSGASNKGESQSASMVNEFGHSKNTAALPEVNGTGNTQQSDLKSSVSSSSQTDGKTGKAETDASAAQDKALADKMDAKAEKQEKISALKSRIGQLQQQLSFVEVQISSVKTGQDSGSGENPVSKLGRLSAEGSMLRSMIQSLQQQLGALQAE